MGIPREEQETTINFTRCEQGFNIMTSDTTMINKLDKLCKIAPEYYSLLGVGRIDGVIVDKEYIVTDKSLLTFRKGKRHIEMSEEEKKDLVSRMQAGRIKTD